MCGRLTLKTPPSEWKQLLLPVIDFERFFTDWQPRYNIAPTQNIAVIARDRDGDEASPTRCGLFRWGLVPSWSADMAIGSRMINARHETLREKKSFIGPLRKRRCLIIADGYYEWQMLDAKRKQPHWIHPSRGGVLQLAGLWETNRRATGQPVDTCTIITTQANAAIARIHDRMPVVLQGDSAARWLATDCDEAEAYALLGPAENELLQSQQVSTYVNDARHEDPQCLVS